jgi:2-succinyl-6-hydroxy-2,4-cyclohexadiene-1-carboxylate synthase
MTLRHVAIGGTRWAVDDAGEGPPVLLLHGFTGTGASLDALAGAFRHDGRRTLAPDLLGHGASDAAADPARHDVARQAADLAGILGDLGAAPASVVGYSFGGRIALRLALDTPELVSSLVLIGSGAGIPDPAERARRRAVDEDLAASIERDGVAAFVDRWEAMPLFASEESLPTAIRARRRAERLSQDPSGLAASMRGAGQGTQEPLHDRLGTLRAPTLLIVGELDARAAVNARAIAAAAPPGCVRVLTIAAAGHAAHLARPDDVRDAILDHIRTAVATATATPAAATVTATAAAAATATATTTTSDADRTASGPVPAQTHGSST